MNLTEQDYNTLSQFINFVSRNAEFRLDVAKSLELYKYLNKLQTQVLPKIEANISEPPKIRQQATKETDV